MPQYKNLFINDPLLTEVAYGYSQAESILPFVAKTINVRTRAGKVLQFGKEQFAVVSTKRTPYAYHKSGRVSGYAAVNYYLEQHTREAEVSWEEIEDAASGEISIDMKELAVLDTVAIIAQSMEQELYTLITNPANFEAANTVAVSAANKFSASTSDPEALVRTWKSAVRRQIGRYPSRAIMSEDVYNALCLHPLFRDRIKYTRTDVTDLDMLAGWFGLPGGIRVVTRLKTDPTTGDLVDMFPAGTMLLFVDGSDQTNQIGAMNESNLPIFQQQPGINRTTATFAQLYVLDGGLAVGKERIREDNDTIVHTVRFTGSVILPSIGATNKSAAGFLAQNLV